MNERASANVASTSSMMFCAGSFRPISGECDIAHSAIGILVSSGSGVCRLSEADGVGADLDGRRAGNLVEPAAEHRIQCRAQLFERGVVVPHRRRLAPGDVSVWANQHRARFVDLPQLSPREVGILTARGAGDDGPR